MTKKEAIRLLTTESEIIALNMPAYLTFLALAIEIGSKDLTKPIARIKKGF